MAEGGEKTEPAADRAFVVWKQLDQSDKLEPTMVSATAATAGDNRPKVTKKPQLKMLGGSGAAGGGHLSPQDKEGRIWRGVAPAIPSDILALSDSSYEEITPAEMAVRRMARSPLIPIGLVATVAALVMMGVSMKRRDSKAFLKYARYRIASQGLTICTLAGGVWYYLKTDGFI